MSKIGRKGLRKRMEDEWETFQLVAERVFPKEEIDQLNLLQQFREDPEFGWNVRYSVLTEDKIKINYIIDALLKHVESSVTVIAGIRGGGKTAIAMWLIKKAHEMGKKVCIVQSVCKGLPDWIETYENLIDIPEGYVALSDETAISFGSRDAMTLENKEMTKMLAILRHKKISIIFVTQHTEIIDKNIHRFSDIMLFKKLCLAPNTIIKTINGNMKIKDITIGDKVLSYNIKNNKFEYQKVTEYCSNQKRKEVKIYLENDKMISCSPEHKWYTKRGLIKTIDLTNDDELFVP